MSRLAHRPLCFSTLALIAVASLALSGCGGDDSATPGPGADLDPPGDGPSEGLYLLAGDCDPLGIMPGPDLPQCGLPFPSDVYLDRSGGQRRVRFGETTLPRVSGGRHVPHDLIQAKDGFSVGSGPMIHLPGATVDGMATPATIERSLEEDHPTVLLEAETGVRVPHWVDLDMSTQNAGLDGLPDERALILRPVVRLKDDTRYIVAIRNVMHRDGHVIEPTQEFKDLRDGLKTVSYSVKRRRALYADIFSRLESAGIPKQNLQVAWDFTTATRENTTGALLHIRDDALAKVGADGPSYVVKEVRDTGLPQGIKRRITVTMTVPNYLTYYMGAYNEALVNANGGMPPVIHRGADGRPAQNGTMEQDVLIHVPESVDDPTIRHGLLQNGHGLFGSRTEGQSGYLARMAADYRWIAFSTNLFGFSGDDVALAINALGARPEYFNSFFDRQVQGHVNQLLAMRMMMGRVARDGIRDASGNVLLPASAIDPSLRAYRGDSQGGIMGTTYMAISTDVTRGLVGEPGMPYSLLLTRSIDWPPYELVLSGTYAVGNAGLNVALMIALIQQGWDRSEPVGYASFMEGETLPGTPEHKILIHPAIGDHQVTTYGAHIIARAVNAVNVRSNDGRLHRPVFQVEAADPPIRGRSAMVEWDFALLPEPLTNIPPTDGQDPHDRVRDLTPAYEQQDHFFRTGEIIWTCDGLCNCDSPGEEERCIETCPGKAPNQRCK